MPAGLEAERSRVYQYGERYVLNAVRVDEITKPDRGPDPFEAIDDFLFHLERSDLYVALIADRHGSPIPLGSERANAAFLKTHTRERLAIRLMCRG